MGKPKSFKDMVFPPARSGTRSAVYAPLPQPPTPRTITNQAQKQLETQFLELKRLINNERCPICSSQLDGGIRSDDAAVYCVSNPEEYKATYKYGLTIPVYSSVRYHTTNFDYEIQSSLNDNNVYSNTVYKIDLSLNVRAQNSDKKKLFSYDGVRMILSPILSEREIENKIKLYTTFS